MGALADVRAVFLLPGPFVRHSRSRGAGGVNSVWCRRRSPPRVTRPRASRPSRRTCRRVAVDPPVEQFDGLSFVVAPLSTRPRPPTRSCCVFVVAPAEPTTSRLLSGRAARGCHHVSCALTPCVCRSAVSPMSDATTRRRGARTTRVATSRRRAPRCPRRPSSSRRRSLRARRRFVVRSFRARRFGGSVGRLSRSGWVRSLGSARRASLPRAALEPRASPKRVARDRRKTTPSRRAA